MSTLPRKAAILSSAMVAFSGSLATTANAQTVTYTYESGTVRTINCQEAFYRLQGEAISESRMTCNGYEMVDKPRASGVARDEICSITDQYDPNNPMAQDDPRVPVMEEDFAAATTAALLHGGRFHGMNLMPAINYFAEAGQDVFTLFPDQIEKVDLKEGVGNVGIARIADNGRFFRDANGDKIYDFYGLRLRPPLEVEQLVMSPYRDVTLECLAEFEKLER